jgi:hypothetical protein
VQGVLQVSGTPMALQLWASENGVELPGAEAGAAGRSSDGLGSTSSSSSDSSGSDSDSYSGSDSDDSDDSDSSSDSQEIV